MRVHPVVTSKEQRRRVYINEVDAIRVLDLDTGVLGPPQHLTAHHPKVVGGYLCRAQVRHCSLIVLSSAALAWSD
jgi:hypothetical protein